jgi:hypothetical protein
MAGASIMMEGESLANSSPGKTWSQTRRGRLVIMVGLLGLFALVFGLAMKSRRMVAEPAALVVDEQHLWFGEVWEDLAFVWTLPITNIRGQDVEIKQFHTTCTCVDIEPKRLVIPAKQKREVRLTLNLTTAPLKEAGSPVRDLEVGVSPEMSVEGRGVARTTMWTIRGRIRSAIQCESSLIDFGSQSELGQPIPSQHTRITTFATLRSLKASCTSSQFDVKVQRGSPNASDSFDLVIAPNGKFPRGEFRCSIALVPELPDGQRLPPKQAEVRGRIIRDIEVSPANILFGACPIGASPAETVAFRSLTGRSFTVTGVRCEGDGLSAERVRTAASFGPTFEVKLRVSTSGDQGGKVFFRISCADGKEDEIAVPVSYYGLKGD